MRVKFLALGVGALPLAACITVENPDKPIDINLNVRVEQEVLVRLDREVDDLITDNPETFPTAPENVPDEPQETPE